MAFKRFGFGAGAAGFVAAQRNVPFGSLVPQHDAAIKERYVYDEFRFIEAMLTQGGAAATGTNVLFTGNRSGIPYVKVDIGTLTVFVPTLTTTGIDVGADAASSEGCEILFGAHTGATARARLGFQPSVDKALQWAQSYFIRLQFSIADVSGCDALYVGFRKAQAYQATFANYTDVAALGFHGTTDATQTIRTYRIGGTGAIAATDVATSKTWADAATHTLGVKVSTTGPLNTGGGIVSWLVDDAIVATTTSFSFAFTNTDFLFPFFRYTNQAGGNAGVITLKGLEIGFEPIVGQ